MTLNVAFTEPIQYTETIQPEGYAYNENGKMLWLQRVLFRVLDWLDARRRPYEAMRFKMAAVDPDEHKLIEILQKANALQLMYGRKPQYLLVGPDVYDRIVHGEIEEAIGVPGSLRYRYSDGHIQTLGFEIVLVPWMSGILPMTEWRTVA